MSRQRWRTKEAARIDRAVRKAGGEPLELTSNGHLRVIYNGRSTVISSKLGNASAFRNAMGDIRRSLGLTLELQAG